MAVLTGATGMHKLTDRTTTGDYNVQCGHASQGGVTWDCVRSITAMKKIA
jgi:hypothetical protein